jgi:DNA repair exonuclease SbcCD nuclease subunit
MSKVLILGDIHIGARSSSPVVSNYQIKFFEDELFPYMKKHNINTILQLGDLFDQRTNTNHVIFNEWKKRFFDALAIDNINMITLLGNHDLASKSNLDVNSTTLLLEHYENIFIIDSPTEYDIYGMQFLLLPWICNSNETEITTAIKSSSSIICAGHLELAGFSMQKGVESHGETNLKDYEQFDLVLSGHYHTRSKKKNVLYTGTPFELTWADYNDQKGFHIFDTNTHNIEFIKTKTKLFTRIEYDDTVGIPIIEDVKDAYVKLVVVNKKDPTKFENFLLKLIAALPIDIKILDIETDFENVDISSDLKLDDTKTLIENFIDQTETELDKSKLKSMLTSLYLESLEVCE